MKQNRQIKNLETEKLRLRVKQLELEKQITRDWKELKQDLSPGNFIAHKLEAATHKKPEGSLLSELINYGVNYLGNKLSEKAGQEVESAIQQGIDKLTEKLKTSAKKK
jgi:gamma-glutamyl-gamma-aminobutyrate hydrolase PuuD